MANHYPSNSSDGQSNNSGVSSSNDLDSGFSSTDSAFSSSSNRYEREGDRPSMALAPLTATPSSPPPVEYPSANPERRQPSSPKGRSLPWKMDWNMVLWAVVGGLPIAIVLAWAVQQKWISPVLGTVVVSVLTALVAGAVFHYLTRGSQQQKLKDDELDLLEVEK